MVANKEEKVLPNLFISPNF